MKSKLRPLTEEEYEKLPQAKPVDGLPSLDFDGLIQYIKNGHAKNVVFLTGAGTSVAAGIPDFRTPGIGLYSNLDKYNLPYPEAVFDISYFPDNPGPFYQVTKSLLPGSYKPVTAHYFPVLFQRHKLLRRFYTQNIDGLDIDAGLDPDNVVECHGGFHTLTCLECGEKSEFKDYQKELESGEIVHCRNCKTGLIKPDVVFFGEPLPDRFHELTDDDFEAADLLIVMGSSLQVSPCNSLPAYCNDKCVRVLINRDMVAKAEPVLYTDGEKIAITNVRKEQFMFGSKLNTRDIFIGGDCQENCKKIIDALGWTDEYNEISKA